MARPDVPPPLRNPRFIAVLLGCVFAIPSLLLTYRPVNDVFDVSGIQIGHDFINVWAAPQLAFHGKLSLLFDLDRYHQAIMALFGHPIPPHSWSYPIFDLFLFWPFAQLPYLWALAAWTIVFFALLASVALSTIERRDRLFALMLLTIAPATVINAVGGQNGFLSAALLIGGVLLIDRRPVISGIVFGLLTFKPHLGFVLPLALLMLCAWRVIAAAILTFLVLIGMSIAAFGIESWQKYFEVIVPVQVEVLNGNPFMISVAAIASSSGVSLASALTLQTVVALPVMLVAAWAVTRTADSQKRAAVLATAAPIVTPYAFNYDLCGVAAVILWKLYQPDIFKRDAKYLILLILGWLIPFGWNYLNVFARNAVPLSMIIIPVLLLALFALQVYDLLISARPRSTVAESAQHYAVSEHARDA